MFTPLRRRARGLVTAALRSGDDAGFTIVESLLALVIFTVLGAAVVTAIVSGTNATQAARTRVVETNLARTDLDQAQAQPTPSPTSYTATPDAGGNQYTVSRSVQIVPTPSASGACPTGSLRRITVSVTWASRSIQLATARAC